MADYLVAIDLGTTKVVSIVGEKINNGQRFRIAAYAEAPSVGIRRGQVENIQSVVGVVTSTLNTIRAIAGIPEISEVYVGIAGQHIRYIENRVEILRPNYEAVITKEEVKKLESDARKLHLNSGEEVLHAIPQTYSVDDIDEITDPVGRLGYKLTGHFIIIIEKGISTKHTDVCMQRLNLSLKELILEPIASARATLSAEEKEMGVVMIDMGGGTTDLIIYKNGIMKHTAIIPFGGNTITSDIKTGCNILFDQAEKIKIQYGSCISSMAPENKIVTVPGINGREPREISFKALAYIIEARMVEIMDMVISEIRKYTDRSKPDDRHLDAGIVFTGGGANMTNLREFVKLKTGMDVRIGKPEYVSNNSSDDIFHPKYATAAGLIMCGFDSREEAEENRNTNKTPSAATTAKTSETAGNDDKKEDDARAKQPLFKTLMKLITGDGENEEV
ncbi:MAG: cell division protein FtsA [Prevotellaceae bacterium]|jgi:cell division protein FtsA|nr:cell division protein FtsA [Prevotellaceae bacterium]